MSITSAEEFRGLRAAGRVVRLMIDAMKLHIVRTADRRPSAHYEHTLVITRSEPSLLTA